MCLWGKSLQEIAPWLPAVLSSGSECLRPATGPFSGGALCRSRLSSIPFPESTRSQCWKPKKKSWGWNFTLSFKKTDIAGTSLNRVFHSGLGSVRSGISMSPHGPLRDMAWLHLGSSFYIPAQKLLQAESLSHGRTHFAPFLSRNTALQVL